MSNPCSEDNAGTKSVPVISVTGKTGRPSKLNDETIARICDALADGMPTKSACAIAGIGVQTLSDWRKDNPEVERRITEAKEKLRHKALLTIGNAIGNGDWRAAEAALKLVFPEYRASNKVEVNASAAACSGIILTKEMQRNIQERHQRALLES